MLDTRESNLIEHELDKYGSYASVTRGVSMWPLFKTDRDMVIIEKPSELLRPFDVALYRTMSGKYTLHRVIKVTDKVYIIRGDNTYSLEYVPHERVIGVLTEFTRKGKHHTVNDRSYIMYSRIWNCIYPVRYLIRIPRPLLVKVYRLFFKRKT